MSNVLKCLFKPYLYLVISAAIAVFIYGVFYTTFVWTWQAALFSALYIWITISSVRITENSLFSMAVGCLTLILYFFGLQPAIISGAIYCIIAAFLNKKYNRTTKVFYVKTYFNIGMEVLITYFMYLVISKFHTDLYTYQGVLLIVIANIVHIFSNILLLFFVDSFYNGTWKTDHFSLDLLKIDLYSIVISLIVVYTYYQGELLLTLALFTLSIPFHKMANMNYILTEQNQELITDTLTQAYNFKYFENTLQNSIQNKKDLALIFIDIDEFKEVNDQYGHSAGNKAIVELANHIKSSIGYKSALCRYGGDEFCIIIHESELNQIDFIADKLISEASNFEVEYENKKFRIRLSIGIYIANGDEEHIQTVIDKADMAMYEAKKLGGHKVVKCNAYSA